MGELYIKETGALVGDFVDLCPEFEKSFLYMEIWLDTDSTTCLSPSNVPFILFRSAIYSSVEKQAIKTFSL